MTDLISFVPPSQAGAANSAATSRATLGQNFDTFLALLTAQVQNQDPLSPLDSTQFTDQLVQFSGVEQQIKSNESLATLINVTRSNSGASLSGYLGQRAEIARSEAGFSGEPITWRYTLPRSAAGSIVTVTNLDGRVVYSTEGETSAGSHDFTWNGETLRGGTADPGAYVIRVVAQDADGTAIQASHALMATVTGVDLGFDEPALTTSAGIFTFSDVRRLTRQ
ncbi:flagellar hook capping protein [bacterium]|nr:flagellar hook capping protein [bacterium]